MSERRTALPLRRLVVDMPNGVALPEPEDLAGSTVAPDLALASVTSKLMEALKWMFSFPAMLGSCLVGIAFIRAHSFFVDPDVWWHIRVGQDILRTHKFPTVDSYSWTVNGQPWIAYEWLGEVVLALLSRMGGVIALAGALVVISSIILLALYGLAATRAKHSKAGFVSALVLSSLACVSFTLRPQMLAYLFLILTMVVLERFRQGRSNVIWALPPLFLLWVNSHGSWIIGLGVVCVYLVAGLFRIQIPGLESQEWTSKQRIRIEAALLFSLCMLPLTPFGTQTAAYPFEVASKLPLGVANVSEWRSMPFDSTTGKIFLCLLLGFIAVQVVFKFVWKLDEFLLFLFGTMMACLHVRFLLLFVPLFAPVLAVVLARWIPPYKRHKDLYLLNAVVMVAMVFCLVRYFPTKNYLEQRIALQFPVATTRYIADHPKPGRLLNEYGFGGYLIGAGEKVFVDGRSDPYERGGVLSDYLHIARLQPGALALLDSYRITDCLLTKDEPLATMLSASPEWKKIAQDNVSVLYERKPKWLETN